MLRRSPKLGSADTALDTAVNLLEVSSTPLNETICSCFFDDFPEVHDPREFSDIEVIVPVFVLILIHWSHFEIACTVLSEPDRIEILYRYLYLLQCVLL